MSNKDIYVKEINQIFSCLTKLKSTFLEKDNINFINSLEEYKDDTVTFLNTIEEVLDND